MKKSPPTAERLREILSYNAETGQFTWLKNGGPRRIGDVAGCVDKRGYVSISVDKAVIWGHQLAYLYQTGEWWTGHIDHIDGEPSNNRWANLRPATASQNQANAKRSKNNKSGFKGVSLFKRTGRWHAQITVNRRNIHLGYFDTAEAAHAAYCAAASKHFGEFARAA
jgi:hypothetical protein